MSSSALIESLPVRSRTPLPPPTNHHNILEDIPETTVSIDQSEFPPNSVYRFDRQANLTRSARDFRPTDTPLVRSKTPGPEFDGAKSSSYRSNTMKPRSKTPNSYEFASSNLQNRYRETNPICIFINLFSFSRSLQSVHPPYTELVVNLTLLRPK